MDSEDFDTARPSSREAGASLALADFLAREAFVEPVSEASVSITFVDLAMAILSYARRPRRTQAAGNERLNLIAGTWLRAIAHDGQSSETAA